MPMVSSGGSEMEKRVSVGNRCLEIRIQKALDVRLMSVREPKKFIGRKRDVKLETTHFRYLTKSGHSVIVWSMLTKYAESSSLWRAWPHSIKIQYSYQCSSLFKECACPSLPFGLTTVLGTSRVGDLL